MPAGGAQPGAGRPAKPGVGDAYIPLHYPSMKAAAHALKIDIAILKDARSKACNAFEASGAVHRERLIHWLKENPHNTKPREEAIREVLGTEEEFVEDYSTPDETGGVGQTLKSLQAYERRLKKRLDQLEQSTSLHPITKQDMVEKAQTSWIKVVNALLKYDLAVDTAKRESGELIPLADAVKGIQALLAWHTVATSDALRNVIPEMEGKTKFDMAALLDPCLRSAIYRTFKMGVKLGKIPEWMGREASAFVAGETKFTLAVPGEQAVLKNAFNPEEY